MDIDVGRPAYSTSLPKLCVYRKTAALWIGVEGVKLWFVRAASFEIESSGPPPKFLPAFGGNWPQNSPFGTPWLA